MATEQQAENPLTHVIHEPTLYFEGQPPNIDRIRVLLPPELSADYNDVYVEAIDTTSPDFTSYARDYLGHMLSRKSVYAHNFTWPKFKLPDSIAYAPDNELFNEDGTAQDWLVAYAFEHYLVPTVEDKGNVFMVMHGTVNGAPGFIGGGLAFPSPRNEDESWVSGGIAAPETNGIASRGKGFGRISQEARVAHVMFASPEKNNLNTGVNIDPEGVSKEEHQTMTVLLHVMDVMKLLKANEPITAESLVAQYEVVRNALSACGYPRDYLARPDMAMMHDGFAQALQGVDMYGLSPATMEARKEILRIVAEAHGSYLTATERIFLSLGGEYLNGIFKSACVREADNWHTRRLILYRDNWQAIAAQRHPELAEVLYNK